MKKIIITLSIIGVILFLIFNNPVDAATETKDNNRFLEDYHSLKFKNLNSKYLNDLFLDISGTVIEIEVEAKSFKRVYKFNTNIYNNIEKTLMTKVIKDLENLGLRELATECSINGIRINRIDLICTNKELEIIKNRAEVE